MWVVANSLPLTDPLKFEVSDSDPPHNYTIYHGKSARLQLVPSVLRYKNRHNTETQAYTCRQINGDQIHLGLRLDGSKVVGLISWIFLRDLLELRLVVFWLGRLSGDFPPVSLRSTAGFRSDDIETDMASSSSSSSSSSSLCSSCASMIGG